MKNGFTLVELVVSLFIFALISAAGVSLLGYSVDAQASAGKRLDEVAAIRRVGALLREMPERDRFQVPLSVDTEIVRRWGDGYGQAA